jgi:hypothetical protein
MRPRPTQFWHRSESGTDCGKLETPSDLQSRGVGELSAYAGRIHGALFRQAQANSPKAAEANRPSVLGSATVVTA